MSQHGNYYSSLFQRYVPVPPSPAASDDKPSEKLVPPAITKRPRGFAAMSPEKQREIASQGGKAAHKKGTAHQFNAEEARSAGRKGGESVSQDREHMSEIGRKGGERRGQRNKPEQSDEIPGITPDIE